jgi:PrtD family type I secretion system ABC transporter
MTMIPNTLLGRKKLVEQLRQPTELQQALRDTKSVFGIVALFSLAINLLLLTPAIYMLQVYDRVLTTGRIETLIMLTIVIAGSLLIMAALESLRTIVTIRVGIWLNGRLGPVLIERGVRARLRGDGTGAEVMRDLTQIQSFIATNGLSFIFDAPWVPIFIVIIWMLHPVLGMTALIAAALMLALTVLNEVLTRQSTTKANMEQIAATQQIDTAFRNAEVVQAMGMLSNVVDRWREKHAGAMSLIQQGSEISGSVQGLTKFIRFFVQSGVLGIGAYLVIEGQLSAGGMIAASILLSRALAPVELAMNVWRNFLTTRIAYQRIQLQLQQNPGDMKRTQLPRPKGHLSVENLTYAPPGSNRPILRGVTFAVEPGEALAIIGPSAAGKSTLCRFIVGLLSPNSGNVRLDSSDLMHWDRSQLGQYIGYLPQDVELFAGSVRQNIARMDPDAKDADVVQAAMAAQAHELVASLPDGYDTQIGDGGLRLSGGQRQRIGLARAIYGNPCLVVLDEPNANLDTQGESALAAALGELKAAGAALIIVGHRPSTLAQADKVMLLKEGRVELFGSREEVLAKLREAASRDRAEEQQKAASAKESQEPAQREVIAS